LYSAKQWGVSPSKIDPSIFKRVPLRFNYETGYFDDEYQVMPKVSFTSFFEKLLNHENIEICLSVDALEQLKVENEQLLFCGKSVNYPVVYTGPLDELFNYCYGELPYRSLKFEWKYENKDSIQVMPVVAYPQSPDFVRIIEYKKIPVQSVKGTTYEVEYSLPYKPGEKNEPYYPLLTEESQEKYAKYKILVEQIENLFVCGRLGSFKYYNMDQALEAALDLVRNIVALP
jgi:UDP-galactopyranose mutase